MNLDDLLGQTKKVEYHQLGKQIYTPVHVVPRDESGDHIYHPLLGKI